MTDIAFHFNVPDREAYTCRLLRKAVRSGAKVVVVGPPAALDVLDRDLWSFSAVDFVPHCHFESEPILLAASPVILAPSPELAPHRQVLLNLGSAVPGGFVGFERLIELVTNDKQDRHDARLRWKQYTEQGYLIRQHDLALKTPDL